MEFLSNSQLEEIYAALTEHNDYFEKHGKVKPFPYNQKIMMQYHKQMQFKMNLKLKVWDYIKHKN